jgi:predicted nucleotidyltransferase component of viral defense system
MALGTLEKDYVLTEVLGALSQVPSLNELLVFKGGTALRKAYFADWRYSEDLDFTVKHDITEGELKSDLEKWYGKVEALSGIGLATKMLHKPNGYARVRVQFLGPLSYPGMIFMDMSFDEPICLEPIRKNVLTAPFSSGVQSVIVYPLEELLAEKMRSLVERGKSRDYYDVWRLLKEQHSNLDFKILATVLKQKLEHKAIITRSLDDFLPKDHAILERYWEKDLGQQINSHPSLDEVLVELRDMLGDFVALHFQSLDL